MRKPNGCLATRLAHIQGKQSLRAFSKILHRPPSTVRNWLKHPGGVVPDVETLYDVALRLGVSPHWLITGKGPRDLSLFNWGLDAAIKRTSLSDEIVEGQA